MTTIIRHLFLFAILLTAFVACEHDPLFTEMDQMIPPDDTTTTNNPTIDKPCNPDSVYFTKDILPILKSNCAFSGCHGDGSAEDGVNLETFQSIIKTGKIVLFNPNSSELFEVITETDPDKVMPPPPANQLTPDQIAKISKWINQGASNNYCDECDTLNVTFSKSIMPIIQNNCQGCHLGGSPQGNISLTNYDQIQNAAMSGELLGVVNHSSGYVPMPYKQNKLSQCKIDQIRLWIENGALND